MLKIDRSESNMLPTVQGLKPYTYKVYVDLTDGAYYINKGVIKNPKYKLLGKVQYKKGEKIQSFVKDIRNVFKNYTFGTGVFICRSTADEIYGRRFIDSQQNYITYENPHYRNASPMLLYNKDVLDFNYKNSPLKKHKRGME